MVTQTPYADCGAKTRAGTPCRRRPMANGRCYMHGGKALVGTANPAFKTGRYSKYLPARLTERYHEALADTELLALRDEIAVLDARLSEVLAEDDPVGWPDVVAIMEQRRKLVESERKRLVDMQQMITTEQAMLLIAAISDAVRRHVDDRTILAAISADVARIIGRSSGDDARGRSGDRT